MDPVIQWMEHAYATGSGVVDQVHEAVAAVPEAAAAWDVAEQAVTSKWGHLAQRVVFGLFVARVVLGLLSLLKAVVVGVGTADGRAAIAAGVLRTVRKLPGVAGQVAAEQEKILQDIEDHVMGEVSTAVAALPKYTALPQQGLSLGQVQGVLDTLVNEQAMYAEKKAFGGIYHEEGTDYSKATMAAYKAFTYSNALYPGLFPGLRKFEAEVVAMSVDMMAGGPDACGTMTSGGTESLVMMLKTYRDMALETRGITRPEFVMPASAHPAINKGCHLLGIKLVIVPLADDFRVDLAAFASALGSNTIGAVGSAPGFPHGMIDPIEEMAAITSARGIPLHVDACLGGYLVPFLKRAGRLARNFDFSIDGVTSISADLHKYGCAHKGASVVLYASPDVRKFQYFQATSWPGGLYCSPSFAGSRPGGVIAAAWAALVSHGMDGFLSAANEVHDAFEALVAGINAIDGLYILGSPDASVLAFSSDEFSILQLADEMTERGWDLARLIKPTCVHWMVGGRQIDLVQPMLADLRECVAIVRAHPERANEGMAGIYGMAGSLPDRTVVDEILTGYMDVLLKV